MQVCRVNLKHSTWIVNTLYVIKKRFISFTFKNIPRINLSFMLAMFCQIDAVIKFLYLSLFHLMIVFQEPGFAMAKLTVTTKIQIIAMASSPAQIRLSTKWTVAMTWSTTRKRTNVIGHRMYNAQVENAKHISYLSRHLDIWT